MYLHSPYIHSFQVTATIYNIKHNIVGQTGELVTRVKRNIRRTCNLLWTSYILPQVRKLSYYITTLTTQPPLHIPSTTTILLR